MRETTLGKKLLPLVQLLPAAAVTAAVLLTLPRTAPVLAEVPQRLSPPTEAASEAPQDTVEEVSAAPKLPYPDGIYTGSSRGYGGSVKVQVTMKDGTMTDIQILDASHETAAFFRRAKRLTGIVLDAQSWDVDAVSEATYTSRGILGAIRNALTGEVVNNPLPPQPNPQEAPVVEEFTAPSAYRDGVYTASAEGFGGPITVQVTISGDAISSISIVSAEGETSSYFTNARHVISTILDEQTPEVDAISGATYSSTGILNAVKAALASAANEEPAESEELTESPAEELISPDTADTAPEQPAVMAPTIEVVQAEEKPASLLDRAKELWDSLFSGQEVASESPVPSEVPVEESEPVEEAPADSVLSDTAEPDSQPAPTEETTE